MTSISNLIMEYRFLARRFGIAFLTNKGVRYCCTIQKDIENEKNDKKLSKAMRAYLERSTKYNEFMQKEQETFIIGKRHLANMMGCDIETFSQEQVDEAIEYLFPSGLFEKKARPFMKPPHLVFPPKKDAEFDETGRPYHFLFYTGKPNFYGVLHDAYDCLKKLNSIYDRKGLHNKLLSEVFEPLNLTGTKLLTKEELERQIVEPVNIHEYNNFTNIMERLATHPNASAEKGFILKHRKFLLEKISSFEPTEPLVDADGRKYILTKDCPRKSARADVKVISPGTGLITINGKGIEYFSSMQSRNQILFPLELTGLRETVDIEATVRCGGETGQAGAIRWGISWGLRCFVSSSMFETMRLAGLLQKDYRHRERKKPGQAGARKKFTWKKR